MDIVHRLVEDFRRAPEDAPKGWQRGAGVSRIREGEKESTETYHWPGSNGQE